jgi:hypothetical protein
MAIAGTMTKFRLDHVALVDRPAQEHALAVIAKSAGKRTVQDIEDERIANLRTGPEGAAKGWDVVKRQALETLDGLAKARASEKKTTYPKAYDAVLKDRPDLYAACR